MKAHKINTLNNFIAGWYIPKEVCTGLIDFFEESKDKRAGMIGVWDNEGSSMATIDPETKDSTDVGILNDERDPRVLRFWEELGNVVEEYKTLYKYSTEKVSYWGLNASNIQRYLPGQGYKTWHTEKGLGAAIYRHLTFMIYLNDITDKGETEFYHQNIKISPEAGLAVIWGSDWTFMHRGIPSPTQTKYIVTGWFNFTEK